MLVGCSKELEEKAVNCQWEVSRTKRQSALRKWPSGHNQESLLDAAPWISVTVRFSKESAPHRRGSGLLRSVSRQGKGFSFQEGTRKVTPHPGHIEGKLQVELCDWVVGI